MNGDKTIWDHALTTFGTNAKGEPEFGSVTFTLDQLFFNSIEDPINRGFNLKSVYSTQAPEEALASILRYEGNVNFINSGQYNKLITPHFGKSMIYATLGRDGRIHVIVSTPALRSFIDAGHVGNGSALVGMKALVDATLQSMETARNGTKSKLVPTVVAIEVEEVIATITQERQELEKAAFKQVAAEAPRVKKAVSARKRRY